MVIHGFKYVLTWGLGRVVLFVFNIFFHDFEYVSEIQNILYFICNTNPLLLFIMNEQ